MCARVVIEMGSHLIEMVPAQSHNSFLSTKGLEKSLCDFTGTIFVQCGNPVTTCTVLVERLDVEVCFDRYQVLNFKASQKLFESHCHSSQLRADLPLQLEQCGS